MDKAKHIYISQIEVRPLAGCQMSPKYAGGFTLCFIPAASEEEARAKILAALAEDHYELVAVEYCIRYSRREWDDLEGKIKSGVAEARVTGDVVYGAFHCWPHDAPDAI
jgi:hypothetical protein